MLDISLSCGLLVVWCSLAGIGCVGSNTTVVPDFNIWPWMSYLKTPREKTMFVMLTDNSQTTQTLFSAFGTSQKIFTWTYKVNINNRCIVISLNKAKQVHLAKIMFLQMHIFSYSRINFSRRPGWLQAKQFSARILTLFFLSSDLSADLYKIIHVWCSWIQVLLPMV